MTDVYNAKTKEDIYAYLTSWLKKTDDETPLVVNGEEFVQEWGFRRAFHIHAVLRSKSTNEYVWWVFEFFDLSTFPTKRYPTFESLLENVTNDYYILWKLDS